MKRKHISFLMPFIDFAFMVIIIFVALLSIAYFEPPGSGGKEIKMNPLQKVSPKEEKNKAQIKVIKVLKKENKHISNWQIKRLKAIITSQNKQIKKLKAEVIKFKKKEVKPKVAVKTQIKVLKPTGKHLYTDLRK